MLCCFLDRFPVAAPSGASWGHLESKVVSLLWCVRLMSRLVWFFFFDVRRLFRVCLTSDICYLIFADYFESSLMRKSCKPILPWPEKKAWIVRQCEKEGMSSRCRSSPNPWQCLHKVQAVWFTLTWSATMTDDSAATQLESSLCDSVPWMGQLIPSVHMSRISFANATMNTQLVKVWHAAHYLTCVFGKHFS